MSDSVQHHRRQPTRLCCPWDSLGKNTGVGCHFLLQCMKVKSESEVAQSCPTLSDPMDCSLPGSSIHGIFQARVLECGAIAFSVIFFLFFWTPFKVYIQMSVFKHDPWGRKESDTTDRLHFHFSLSCIGEGNGNPLQCSCLENPRDGGAWGAALYGVAQSRTQLKQLSSSSSSRKGLWRVPRRNENLHPHKIFYMGVHSSIVHKSAKMETIHMSINWWMGK